MNKLKIFLFITVMILSSTCVFTSCSNDDDDITEQTESKSLIGTWDLVSSDFAGPYVSPVTVIVFKEDGTYSEGKWDNGTYVVNGDKLTVKSSGVTLTYKYVLANNELILSLGTYKIKYKRR